MNQLQIAALAAMLARKHRIPKALVSHPAVIIPRDEFMENKLKDPDYVPYCLVEADCGRVRRTVYGFECPNCGNKMNYDLTHYDGNKNVQYAGAAPDPMDATAGIPVPGEYWKFGRNPDAQKVAEHRLKQAEIARWNADVEARNAAKKGSK